MLVALVGVGVIVLFVAPLGLAGGGPQGAGTGDGSEAGERPMLKPTAAPEPTKAPPPDVRGLAYPIAGGCLPENDALMPGAARAYRHGVHEGVDFYDSDNCVFIGRGTEVLAVGAGTVTRADRFYQELTPEASVQLLARVERGGSGTESVLDAFRGRQVWIDHGRGLVTRYCHLGGIVEGLTVGAPVQQGALIGYVGDSGTLGSVEHPGVETHLHFEIRTGESFLGQGQAPEAARALYEWAFTP